MKIFCSKKEHSLLEMSFVEAGFETNTAFEKSGFTSHYQMGELELIIYGKWEEEVRE